MTNFLVQRHLIFTLGPPLPPHAKKEKEKK